MAGAVLSTVSTILQMAVVLLVTDRATFWAMRFSLLFAGAAAIIYGALFTIKTASEKPQRADEQTGRAFNLTTAIVFAATVSAILLTSAGVNRWLGSAGLAVATGIAGLADTHSAAISVASLASAEKISVPNAVLAILVGLTTNTITKAVVAMTTGGRGFALQIIPGLLLVILTKRPGFASRFIRA